MVKVKKSKIIKKKSTQKIKRVAVVMGSVSDFPVMKEAVKTLKSFQVEHTVEVVSAHRTPEKLRDFSMKADSLGYEVIIAGAGGAAHLPGMIAAWSDLTVIGVPIKNSSLDGWDSILSILQMPKGVPVATVALNNSQNAALLALKILAIKDPLLKKRLEKFKKELCERVMKAKLPVF